MFPYGGLRIDDAETAKGAKTFGDLTQTLHTLVARSIERYLEGARTELLQYFSDIPDLTSAAPVYRNYSLKFSKSASKWTAYIFTYHTAPMANLKTQELETAGIPLNDSQVDRTLATGAISKTPLEENVVAFLKSPVVRFWSHMDS
jgi:hypothetical protein